jgi:L-rhamnonate dehydratase
MKIVRVAATALRIPVGFEQLGVDHRENTSLTYVAVETDSGLVGHGITGITQATPVTEAINTVLGPAILGLDPLLHERLWHIMNWTATPWAQSGYASHAISAIDLALWDIKGQAFNEPVWRLIGGARSSVPVYATCGFSFLDDDQLVEAVKRVAGMGFAGIKMQVGRPGRDERKAHPPVEQIIRRDAVRIARVREALGPELEIAVDAGVRLDLPSARKLCQLIEQYDIAFFEEPVLQNDVLLMAQLRRETTIPITAGQNEGLAYRFRDMLMAGAVDIIQPNVIITGGMTQCLRIAGMAAAFNTPISNGGGAPHYNMHLQAGLQHGTAVEWQFSNATACQVIFPDAPMHKDGAIEMPEKPGFGLVPDHDTLKSLAV